MGGDRAQQGTRLRQLPGKGTRVMECINEEHDHFESNDGATVRMVCSHCGDRLHFDCTVGDYIHDNEEHTCWLHSRARVQGYGEPCKFNVGEILASVLPEIGANVDWDEATARETSDLLNNLRDGFSEFWGVRV